MAWPLSRTLAVCVIILLLEKILYMASFLSSIPLQPQGLLDPVAQEADTPVQNLGLLWRSVLFLAPLVLAAFYVIQDIGHVFTGFGANPEESSQVLFP